VVQEFRVHGLLTNGPILMSCKLILQCVCHCSAHVAFINIEVYLKGLDLRILV
jgi:hypothetical protein